MVMGSLAAMAGMIFGVFALVDALTHPNSAAQQTLEGVIVIALIAIAYYGAHRVTSPRRGAVPDARPHRDDAPRV
jgi:hypothetical protein